MQTIFKQLVQENRFEFVNGGWVASDEACPIYEDLIENIVTGHEFLQETFGITPKIAWHCDSFGHSSVMNELFQLMGYESLFFGRMTDAERLIRIANKTMDFIWQPIFEGVNGPKSPKSKGLYTHLMYETYTVPCGVPMTNYWNKYDAGILRTQFMADLNTNTSFADSFIQCMVDMANAYETDNVLVTWGYDFAYFDAFNTFGLIDDVIAFMNVHSDKFTFVFSTVNDYLVAVQSEFVSEKIQLQTFNLDFFPMEEIYKDSFWTGYYSSRSNSKRAMREFSAVTQLSNTLYALDGFQLNQTNWSNLGYEAFVGNQLLTTVGLMTHHDTITGTSF